MKKTIVIVGVILSLLFSISYLFLKGKVGVYQPQPDEQKVVSSPIDANLAGTTTGNVASSTKQQLSPKANSVILALLQKPDVIADLYNPGIFYLGNKFPQSEGETQPNYVITFTKDTEFFNIVLLTQPIQDAQLQAESYLKNELGVPEAEMCNLNYSLSVPEYVSTEYSGTNLKLTFCSESTPL